jgi:hypothetical protein
MDPNAQKEDDTSWMEEMGTSTIIPRGIPSCSPKQKYYISTL